MALRSYQLPQNKKTQPKGPRLKGRISPYISRISNRPGQTGKLRTLYCPNKINNLPKKTSPGGLDKISPISRFHPKSRVDARRRMLQKASAERFGLLRQQVDDKCRPSRNAAN
jgi:hypothetical protein